VWTWVQARDPPANRSRANEEDVTGHDRGIFPGANASFFLSGPNRFLDAGHQPSANFLKGSRLLALRIKSQFLQKDAGERGIPAKVLVMHLVDVEQPVDQGVMRISRLQCLLGHRGKFFVEDEKDQITFVLRVIKKGSEADVGALGDLADGGGIVPVL